MSFARVNPIGWAQYEIFSSAQANALDINVSRALDGYAGGAYTPSATLELDGAGVPTGPTMKLRAGATGAALHAVQNAAQAGLLVAGASSVSQVAQPANGAVINGLNNIRGPGGVAVWATGGGGGSGGAGAPAGFFFGGNASASGQIGGYGLYAQGGIPYDSIAPTDFSGVGLLGVGATPVTGQRRGAPGVYALAGRGASGGYGGVGLHAVGGQAGGSSLVRAGIAGLFQGYGTTGYGELESLTAGAGLLALGSPASSYGIGVIGIGATGTAAVLTYGGYFEGRSFGPGLRAVPGSSTTTAAEIDGGLSFASATGVMKNPLATTAMTNAQYAKSIIKAWGLLRDGVLMDGFNIQDVAIDGGTASILEVTMASAMRTTDYMVICQGCYQSNFGGAHTFHPTIPGTTAGDFDARTTTFFELVSHEEDGAAITWADGECYFIVLGEQS